MSKAPSKREFQLGEYWISKREESGTYYKYWYDGKTRQTRCLSLRTKNFDEATQKLTDWFILNQQKPENQERPPLLAEIFARYYESHGQHLNSRDLINLALRYWLEFHEERTVEEACAPTEQERFHHWLIHDKGLKPNSAQRIVANGKTGINWAWKRGEIDRVPYIAPVKNIGVIPPKGRPMSIAEVARMIECATEPHLVDFIIMMIGMVARPDAVYDLTFDRCDFENNMIVQNPPNRPQTKKYRPTTKMGNQLKEYLLGLSEISESDHVINYKGRSVKSIRTTWNKTRKMAGLDSKVVPYSLRHTMARYMRASSVPAWEVSAQLGHKQLAQSTTEIYAPFDPAYLLRTTEAIEKYFSELAYQLRTKKIGDFLEHRKIIVVDKEVSGGAKRDRTADLLHAMQALSQLSYSPETRQMIGLMPVSTLLHLWD